MDKPLYEAFWNWLTWKLPDHRSDGADNATGDMYDFLEWIHETNRPPMTGRIAQTSLDNDVRAYAADYIGREVPAIAGFRNRLLNLKDMLRDFYFRTWAQERRMMFQGFDGGGSSSPPPDPRDGSRHSGRSSSGSNQGPGPYDEDRQLYQDFWNWLTEKLSDRRSRGADIAAGDMHDFLKWIRETNRPPMADRIAQPSLDTDVRAYAADYIGREASAIGGFRNRLLNLRDMLRDFEIENRVSARGAMFQGFEGGPSSLPQAPAIPSDRETSAADARTGMPERDFGACVPSDWRGGAAPDTLIAELRKSHLLPMQLRPRNVLINGMWYVAAVWSGRGLVTPNNPEGENIILTAAYRELALQPQRRLEPMNEVGPSSSVRPAEIRPASGSSGGRYQRPNLPDIGTRVGAGWIHGPRVADTALINVLRDFGLLPTSEIPMPCFYIHDEPYTAEQGPNGSILVVHRPLAR
ncbi:hypothetical protein AS156_06975 [Bradyrhizobium macuxiense]|uniref:Uncharacterized protein n=1 Tax=Bradyrhizobium macuxiense TaxID=1755647 RepID=A0A109JT61_9BRAD|nr:hypothetical protein [Bradyrhizobium macuxiense]KWV54702.1 hypothetical protein AS156_06975 [Bradyrhizobium macuxiense]